MLWDEIHRYEFKISKCNRQDNESLTYRWRKQIFQFTPKGNSKRLNMKPETVHFLKGRDALLNGSEGTCPRLCWWKPDNKDRVRIEILLIRDIETDDNDSSAKMRREVYRVALIGRILKDGGKLLTAPKCLIQSAELRTYLYVENN